MYSYSSDPVDLYIICVDLIIFVNNFPTLVCSWGFWGFGIYFKLVYRLGFWAFKILFVQVNYKARSEELSRVSRFLSPWKILRGFQEVDLGIGRQDPPFTFTPKLRIQDLEKDIKIQEDFVTI